MADFIVELTYPQLPEKSYDHPWHLYVDGSSTSIRVGAGMVLISPSRQTFTTAVRFDFPATNNEAEYEALIGGLNMALSMGVRRLMIYSDSQLIVYQVRGEYEARGEQMVQYQLLSKQLLEQFDQVYIEQLPRADNSFADALARLASADGVTDNIDVVVTTANTPSVPRQLIVSTVTDQENWMTPIMKYLKDGELPDNKAQATLL